MTSTPVNTTRRRFLELAGGAAMAAGIIITGAIPAGADPIASWLRTNRQQLPRTYAELVALPLEFRTAAYQELTAAERSAAWVAHLTGNRAPSLTTEQSAVLDAALALAANPSNFTGAPAAAVAVTIAGRATAAFGVDRAREIFATLGPSGAPAATTAKASTTSKAAAITTTAVKTTALASCQCSTASDYCGGHCQSGGCAPRSPGCGFLYQYACNGHCV